MARSIGIEIENHDTIQYLDGEHESWHVRLKGEDGRVINTGRGFDSIQAAQLFAAGLAMGLRSVCCEALYTYIDTRSPIVEE